MGRRSDHNILSSIPPTTTGPRVLWGAEQIGEYLGVHRLTAWRWIKKRGLPAAQMHKGKWLTTTSLIDHWIVTMRQIQLERKKAHSKDN